MTARTALSVDGCAEVFRAVMEPGGGPTAFRTVRRVPGELAVTARPSRPRFRRPTITMYAQDDGGHTEVGIFVGRSVPFSRGLGRRYADAFAVAVRDRDPEATVSS